jgi:hypothetical protein
LMPGSCPPRRRSRYRARLGTARCYSPPTVIVSISLTSLN